MLSSSNSTLTISQSSVKDALKIQRLSCKASAHYYVIFCAVLKIQLILKHFLHRFRKMSRTGKDMQCILAVPVEKLRKYCLVTRSISLNCASSSFCLLNSTGLWSGSSFFQRKMRSLLVYPTKDKNKIFQIDKKKKTHFHWLIR